MTTHPQDVPLTEARRIVRRAVDKAEQLGLRGGIAVVGASGGLVSASRLDHGGLGGMARATSKAWISATQQIPSAEHLHRMTSLPAPISNGFVRVSPQAMFPGAGGLPLHDSAGHVVGGIATSGATVSPFLPVDVAPEVVSAAGRPANPEDLLIAYALGVPYVGQHGDDAARWAARFGDLTIDPDDSLGTAPAPDASRQVELDWAIGLVDRVIAAAAERGVRVAVAVVDPGGDPIQQDRMDDSPVAGPEVALATATTAARYGLASDEVEGQYGATARQLGRLAPFPFLTSPGGLPVVVDGRVVGGIGVGGVHPRLCAELARAASGS